MILLNGLFRPKKVPRCSPQVKTRGDRDLKLEDINLCCACIIAKGLLVP